MGLVSAVFDERTLSGLPGSLASAHTRYSTTTARRNWANAQRSTAPSPGGLRPGHNGNLTHPRPDERRRHADQHRRHPTATSWPSCCPRRSPPTTSRLGRRPPPPGAAHRAAGLEGAFSFVLLDATHVYGVARDPTVSAPVPAASAPWTTEAGLLASESPALDVIGAAFVRELEPGELVVIDETGVHSEAALSPLRPSTPSSASSSFVYFAGPTPASTAGRFTARGATWANCWPSRPPVARRPRDGRTPTRVYPRAEGYARRSGIPTARASFKNRYIGRTFIEARQIF